MVSPQKAAEIAGVSRRTIMVAIENRALKASRNNRNHWQISDEDLQTWMAPRSQQAQPASLKPSDTPTDTITETDLIVALLEEQLKSAQAEAAGYREEIDRLKDEHLIQMAESAASFNERLTQRDGDYQQAMEMLREAQRPRGLWEWLTGARPKA